MEKYETIDFLGEGSFAKVSKAKDIKTGDFVAIKKLKKKYSTWQECLDLREVKSLNKFKQNDNIIKLREMIRIEDNLYLVFEYMEKNLYQLITERKNKKFCESQIRCILFQTLQGVAYMHKYGFFHRDLKPENLLVNGEKIKIADFGLAREIRSIPPYTDYVCTRYYRAPECILKSTNYNSPVDIWAIGCIMAELYNFKPLFYGSSEKEVLFRIASVLGNPSLSTWGEGLQLAKKIDLKFATTYTNCTSINLILPEASKDAIDLIQDMLKWDPNKRGTAADLLQHSFFKNFPLSNRINTPEYNNDNTSLSNNSENISKKSYNSSHIKLISINTQIGDIKLPFKQIEDTSYIRKNEDEINKIMDIHKLKNEKIQDDIKFEIEHNKFNYFKDEISPIANKKEEEFDFEIEKLFNSNNKDRFEANSILNTNISNLTKTYLNNGNIPENYFNSYKNNKNFFDNSVLNKINNSGCLQNVDQDLKNINQVNNTNEDSDANIFINQRRKNNLNVNFIGKNNQNNNEHISGNNYIDNNEEINKINERNKSDLINNKTEHQFLNNKNNKISSSEKNYEIDFENCNVSLKNNIQDNNIPFSRKRSAFKFIENNLEKEKINSNLNNFNSSNNLIKSHELSSDPNIKSPSIQGNNNGQNTCSNNMKDFVEKDTDNKNKKEKKPEYESRRKKQINFVNEINNNIVQAQLNNNNLQNFENQQKNNKDNILNYESRRMQGNQPKKIIVKEKEGENISNINKNSLKI